MQMVFGGTRDAAAAALLAVSISSSPFGNVGAAWEAVSNNPEALTCNLDNQNVKEGQSACQQLDDVVRFRAGKLFTIRQDWGGSASTGAAIWNGANMAVWYLENQIGATNLKDKSVLELGAGVGFTSIVASAMGANTVLITDGNEAVLKLADENISINLDTNGKSIKTQQLRWNVPEDEKAADEVAKGGWDYILASDVTYKRAAWPDLMATIAHLSSTKTRTILSMEPRNVGEVEGVLAEAKKLGLTWEEVQTPIDKEAQLCNLLCGRVFVLRKE